jgi:hypothetical protein
MRRARSTPVVIADVGDRLWFQTLRYRFFAVTQPAAYTLEI